MKEAKLHRVQAKRGNRGAFSQQSLLGLTFEKNTSCEKNLKKLDS